jgi:hypothetical protein
MRQLRKRDMESEIDDTATLIKHQDAEIARRRAHGINSPNREAMLKELGLPVGLIEHMQTAPAPLDLGEDPDPYGMQADAAKGVPDVAAE